MRPASDRFSPLTGEPARVVVVLAAVGALASWLACGAAIDLGGASDDGGPDAALVDGGSNLDEGGLDCNPCVAAAECSSGRLCARFAADADTYCGTPCAAGGCDGGETCRSVAVLGGTQSKVCVPTTGRCPTAVGPQSDGAVLDRCGDLIGPKTKANCDDCEFDCQMNGCYGGWWCNTTQRRCEKPPKTCP